MGSLGLLRLGQPDIAFLVHQRKVQAIRRQAVAYASFGPARLWNAATGQLLANAGVLSQPVQG
jgi:hypothetical protein